MSYQNVFKRHELKYLITKQQQMKLYGLMEKYMIPDKYGKGIINNIYFDTPDKLLIRGSLEKPIYKEKLRVRSYGETNSDTIVFVEIKKKYEGIVYKRRIKLTEKTAMDYLIKRTPLIKESQISKEIDYLMDFYQEIEPSIHLSYNREAFFGIDDESFRMTFDQDILMRDYDLSLTSGAYGKNIIDEGVVILEVKTNLGLPKWLLGFLNDNIIYKRSFSKYGNAYNKFMLPDFLEKNNLSQNKKGGVIYAA